MGRYTALIVAACALPLVYAQTLMQYPCKPEEKLISENGIFYKRSIKAEDCSVQDFFRSWHCLAMGPGAGIIALLLFFGSHGIDYMSIACIGSRKFSPGLLFRKFAKK